MNFPHTNGDFASAELLDNDTPKTDWRYAALNDALHAIARDGSPNAALLRAIRLHRSDLSTVLFWTDHTALLDFCARESDDFRSLMNGHDFHHDENEAWIYMGWYALTWRGAEIEIAISPDTYDCGNIFAISRDEAAAKNFIAAAEQITIRPRGRCLVYTGGWESAPDLDEEIGKVTWDDIVLPPQLLQDVRVSVEAFFANRATYESFGFAWRRGLLLIGPPGTGKTMISKAASAMLPDLPFLYVRDLRKDHNNRESILEIFKRARLLAPCLLVFDDLDGFLTDDNRTVFLNELDGFKSNEGLFVIASSNHPDKIDEALLRRPSRFDRVFHIGLPNLEERREYSRRLLSRSHLAARLSPDFDAEKVAENVAQKSDGFTPAYLKEAFTSAALLRAHEGASVLDEHFEAALFAQIEELKKHLKRSKNPVGMTEMRAGNEAIGLRRASE